MLRLEGVSKRFRRGELYDSLRDSLPALMSRLVRRTRSEVASPREFWALKDISFSVGRGEVLGIIGHNGAGKSTILKLLSGLMKPTSGTIEVRGPLSALIEIGAGFHPDLTGRENIYLNGAILGLSRADVKRKFDQIVEFSGLSAFLDTPVKRYSTGMYARLGFAVAAHVDSDILLVDEVLSVGDYLFRKRCMERMQEIVQRGAAVVFVSHDLDSISKFCTNVILLDQGQILCQGAPSQVTAAYFDAGREKQSARRGEEVYISSHAIRGREGPQTHFKSGDDAWIDLQVTANRRMEGLSLAVTLRDARGIDLFHASMLRLGIPTFTLEAGQTKRLTFHLKLHLAGGAFLAGAVVYSYGDGVHESSGESEPTPFHYHDELFPMDTLVIDSPQDIGGIANLYPEITLGPALPTHRLNGSENSGRHEQEHTVSRTRPAMMAGVLSESDAKSHGRAAAS
jgi:ABC-type polysaccharide/polyol phosphate transport system ATPase subunit